MRPGLKLLFCFTALFVCTLWGTYRFLPTAGARFIEDLAASKVPGLTLEIKNPRLAWPAGLQAEALIFSKQNRPVLQCDQFKAMAEINTLASGNLQLVCSGKVDNGTIKARALIQNLDFNLIQVDAEILDIHPDTILNALELTRFQCQGPARGLLHAQIIHGRVEICQGEVTCRSMALGPPDGPAIPMSTRPFPTLIFTAEQSGPDSFKVTDFSIKHTRQPSGPTPQAHRPESVTQAHARASEEDLDVPLDSPGTIPAPDNRSEGTNPPPVVATELSLEEDPAKGLELLGTVVGNGVSPMAVIKPATTGQRLYVTGDTVNGARILEIKRRQVLLEKNGKTALLTIKDKHQDADRRHVAQNAKKPRRFTRKLVVPRKQIAAMEGNFENLSKQIRVTPLSEGDQLTGLKVDKVDKKSMLYKTLGLRAGDCITGVNDLSLDSVDAMTQLYNKITQTNDRQTLDIHLERRGRPGTLRYLIR